MERTRLEIDARGLEPPQPLVRILEGLDGLPPGGEIRARTDRNPVHLHALLSERGLNATTEPATPPEHGFLTIIRRPA